MSKSDTTAHQRRQEWLDILSEFVFQISDDVLRENLEAALTRLEARYQEKLEAMQHVI